MSQKFINGDNLKRTVDYLVDGTIPIANSNFAPAFVQAESHEAGSLCTNSGKLYECIKEAPANTPITNTEYFVERSVADVIEMIKNGSIVAGHSQVADNLSPYSEDSGTTQENPFISQGTGTDNNSVIVTTGTIARQLEKQGNTIPIIQLLKNGNFADTSEWTRAGSGTFTVANNIGTLANVGSFYISQAMPNIVAGHKYYVHIKYKLVGNGSRRFILLGDTTSLSAETSDFVTLAKVTTASTDNAFAVSNDGLNLETQIADAWCFDITDWNSFIVTDLTSNPEHFSWYYNGSLAYDAGSLQNCNGRYLECGQRRQLWDEEWELGRIDAGTGQNADTGYDIRSKGYILVIPNRTYCFRNVNTGNIFFYDKDKNFISSTGALDAGYPTFTTPANCVFVRFCTYTSTITTYGYDITISLYYTPAEGGEGYDQYYPYVAPIQIDTGNETLKAFDKKLPSGVIERNGGEYTFTGNESVSYNSELDFFSITTTIVGGLEWTNHIVMPGYLPMILITDDMATQLEGDGSTIRFTNHDLNGDTSALLASIAGKSIQYELSDSAKYTEQGTPFSEYADINDYSYMAWFDTDGNLVSIPQGCKLFYPVDYKGFLDDGVMYTDGDFTALAKKEDITDTALNARGYYKMQDLLSVFGLKDALGGTLRQQLAVKESIDFLNTDFVDLGELNWTYSGSNGVFDASKPSGIKEGTNALSSLYKVIEVTPLENAENMTIQIRSGQIYIKNTTYADATAFKEAMKGQLLAYEKATT